MTKEEKLQEVKKKLNKKLKAATNSKLIKK